MSTQSTRNDIHGFAGLRRLSGGSSGRLARRCALLVVMVSALGCTPWREYFANGFKVGPNFKRPAAPVEAAWIDSRDSRIRATEADLRNWWTVFRDPVLDRLVDTAYRQNLNLREASFRILQTRARLGIAQGTLFPQTQTMNGDYERFAQTRNTANRSFIAKRFYDQWDWGFNLVWEIDFWGRIRRMIESADEALNASVENYDGVLVTMLGDVAFNYVQIRTLQREIELTEQNVKLQNQTLILADARFRGGTATDLDVEQARTVMKATEAQIPALRITLRQANNQLCILMGMPPEDLQRVMGPGPIPTAPPEAVVGIPADLLRRRPDVRMAERQAAAQSAQIGIAEAEFYPHISIIGTLDYSAEKLGKLVEPGSFSGIVGPTYSWNLLNYGRILNNVRYQEAVFQQLVTDYQLAVLNAAKETENGLVTYLQAQDQTKSQSESVEAAQKAVEIALAQYRGGQVDFNRVAVLELQLVQQQNLLAQARGQIATGLINVFRALGGGWEIRLDPAHNNPPETGQPPTALPPVNQLPEPVVLPDAQPPLGQPPVAQPPFVQPGFAPPSAVQPPVLQPPIGQAPILQPPTGQPPAPPPGVPSNTLPPPQRLPPAP
ncbi:MAG TPA: efflux transporter outer membrane subunit [Pirellulales bacterium]|nr:efflux transporter outer membrane subunit [Pirellulales bacterium]